ncbi:putative MFS multidrug transporter [Mollisia scopiformis]|uniref:Putative MFS multidrug transporter n=1 Tax=Mollisia scopiformis TaxID=149040 RepID=A0A194WVH9_MOLSC|nr:putative MFS multidrug transporter [Mollisia scopiformis]KUJ11674.1 putative MFS multidrug transporter [Mollisia scopiformis]
MNDTQKTSSTTHDSEAMESKEKKDMAGTDGDIVYPSGIKLALLMLSIFTAMFLVSLDKLIISTAIPQITDDFKSADDIGWYGTAYLLTNCAFQLVFGKLYKFLPIKATFLTSILLFEAGSALCGAAPSSIAFILGRALAGLGAGGVLAGTMAVMVYSVPLQKRPKYQGYFGAVFGVSSVLGPTVGGAFTTHVTWRWCFYLNLPIGGAVMILIFFLLHIPDRAANKMSPKEKLQQVNILGLLGLIPGIVCLCLALQWGGTKYTWGNGRVVALLVLAFALLIFFALVQVWKPEQAIIAPRVFVQRSIAAGFWTSICIGAHQTLFLYYLPIWFQAIKGKTAVDSGIDLLPMVLPIVFASIGNGELVSRIGYYTPSLIFGVCLTTIGSGLFTTFEPNTSTGKWVGYQIIYGFGLGCSSQAPNMAAQTVLPRDDVALGASLMFFGQTLFGAVFTSVGQNVLDNQLTKRLAGIPGIDSRVIQSTGATDLLKLVPAQYYTTALDAYDTSLRVVYRVGLCMACLAILGAASMEFRTVKKKTPPKDLEGEGAAKEANGQHDLKQQEATDAMEGTSEKATAGALNNEEKIDGREATTADSSETAHTVS